MLGLQLPLHIYASWLPFAALPLSSTVPTIPHLSLTYLLVQAYYLYPRPFTALPPLATLMGNCCMLPVPRLHTPSPCITYLMGWVGHGLWWNKQADVCNHHLPLNRTTRYRALKHHSPMPGCAATAFFSSTCFGLPLNLPLSISI